MDFSSLKSFTFRKSIPTIFDLGAHTGEDTDFYLQKGFKVVAVEANPRLCEDMRSRFATQIRSNQLSLIDKAITDDETSEIEIYINNEKNDWSSLYQDIASKDKYEIEPLKVETCTLESLFEEFGVPYYLKCDLELFDIRIARKLLQNSGRPDYVSFEIHNHEILDVLVKCGYTEFHIRNQLFNGFIEKPNPTLEGKDYWPGPMGGFHSGLFGKDLPPSEWKSNSSTKEILDAYEILSQTDFLKFSWLDVHARKSNKNNGV